MSFIRKKQIPPRTGNWYDYEVETIHRGGKVIQKHIRYIGKSGTGSHLLTGGTHSLGNDIPSTMSPSIKEIKLKVTCKFCGSQDTRKYGTYKGIQNYFCNECKTKFTGTDALSHGRVSPQFIANALNEYYGGMSFHDIQDNIEQQTDENISHTL
jgi:ribosomal protein L37AE/L43A